MQPSWLGYLTMRMMNWLFHSNSDLNPAVRTRQRLRSSIPCVLPVEFHHGRGKMVKGSSIPGNPPTYEFYNPSFVARQFGLGELPPRLFFKNILKPREDISDVLEASRAFQLGSDLPSFLLAWLGQSQFFFQPLWLLVARMVFPSLALSRVLPYLSAFEDQALKVKKIHRNLSSHEALMA